MSMILGWLVAVVWLFFSVWENVTINAISNSGMLGATVPVPVGWWSVFFSLGLCVLAVWVSWGMWPFQKTPEKAVVSEDI